MYAGIVNLKWTKERLDKLKDLYDLGLSMREVASEFGLSIWTINNAMRRHGVVRRKSSETNKIRFFKSPLSFNTKSNLNSQERMLKIAGLMLYWAEGSKRNKHVVDFANCDEEMIRLFLRFLRIIYGIREDKLRVLLYCYSDQNPSELIDFLSDLMKIPRSQFTKPYVKSAPDSRVHGKMEKGLVHIRYADMRLLSVIMQEIGHLTETL